MGKTVKVHTGSGRFWHINDESNICQSVGVNKDIHVISSLLYLKPRLFQSWTMLKKFFTMKNFLTIQNHPIQKPTSGDGSYECLAIPEPDLRFDLDVWQQGSINENITSICFLKLRTSVLICKGGDVL